METTTTTTTTTALTNPLVKILDKPRHAFTRSDLLTIIRKLEIRTLTFHYTGWDGKLKELLLPIESIHQAERLLAQGERVDGSSLFKGLVDAGGSDLYVIPVYRSAFLNPFLEGSLDFICRFVNRTGELAPYAPDNILLKTAQQLRDKTGFELHALGELEFYLISAPDDDLYPAARQSGYHAAAPFVKHKALVDEMALTMARITGAVKYAHGEVGYISSIQSELAELNGKHAEQFEIEGLLQPIEETADNMVLGKWLVRNLAARQGVIATFAPKLEEGLAGSGLHFHMALKKENQNAMLTPEQTLSIPAKKLIGGLCYYAAPLSAFGNTVASSYLRLVKHQEAPTQICWSDMNRHALVRVPLGWQQVDNLSDLINPKSESREHSESRQTVELRSPDGSAQVHLLLAGITQAVLAGLTEDNMLAYAEDRYVQGNFVDDPELSARLESLPGSCMEAAQRLRKERAFFTQSGCFDEAVIDATMSNLEAEQDLDVRDRLQRLSPAERQQEIRRILHKDLHKR
ncbi:MAG: glutamine synthetase family protein [Candidatus Marinimicrobia bacterium]|nr:glutamine synthetase family protein [Candidatus Neomarinimicrobiota bacterium]